jgi:hypothetical protein
MTFEDGRVSVFRKAVKSRYIFTGYTGYHPMRPATQSPSFKFPLKDFLNFTSNTQLDLRSHYYHKRFLKRLTLPPLLVLHLCLCPSEFLLHVGQNLRAFFWQTSFLSCLIITNFIFLTFFFISYIFIFFNLVPHINVNSAIL